MIRGYAVEEGRLRPVPAPLEAPAGVVWLDLVDPTDAEERAVEVAVGLEVPTREEMAEIEDSSRLYAEDGAVVMTANLPVGTESDDPVLAPVTFILAGDRLVTVRYHEPRAFRAFPQRAERLELGCTDGSSVLLSLLEVVVDRLADILEKIGRDVDRLSRSVFRPEGKADYQATLRGLGRQGDLAAHVNDSLVSLERLFVFLTAAAPARVGGKDGKARLKTLGRDTRFLSEHAASLSAKLNFLLDATLGMISIEQNAIIKIFSVAAVIFLPPTLVGTVYGMNFDVMPELHWVFGYPFALAAMVLSAVVSYWVFKSRGWL
jgi:magnesium transporter